MSRLVSLSAVLIAMLVAVPAASAATRYVATTGSDVGNDCLTFAAPCQTIQHGVSQAVAGDGVSVAAGTYAETVTVSTPLTLQGAEAGVDGRERPLSAGSTRVQGGIVLQADATVDGFYIDTPPVHGIRVTAGTATIRNTVFFHAANALYVSSPSPNLLVERNDFSDTVPAGLNDYAIFAHAGGPLTGVVIRDNAFGGYDNAGGAGGSTVNVGNAPGLLVEGNTDHDAGSFLVLTDTSGATIRDNTGDTFSGSALYLGRGNANVTIQGNTLSNGTVRGIRFGSDFGTGASTGYQILGNQITGFPYGLLVADGAVGDTIEVHGNRIVDNTIGIQDDRAGGADVDAGGNWWGCNAGPGDPDCDAVVATNGGTIDTSSPLQFGGLAAAPTPHYALHDYTVSAQVGAPEPLADGWPVTFTVASGTIGSPQQTADGGVSTPWTAGAPGGAGLTATLDNETLSLNPPVLADDAPDTIIDTRPANVSNAPIVNATWTFHATDVADPGGPFTFECQLDGGGWSACASPYVVANLGEGDHTFEVRATDPFAHTDASPASDSVLVDLTKPTITVNLPPARSQDPGENVLPTYLYESNVAPDVVCTDPLAGSPPGASGVADCPHDAIDTSTLGVHPFDADATDNAGNAALTVHRTYRVHPPRYGDYVGADSPKVYWRMDDPKGSGDGGATDASAGGTFAGDYKSTGAPVVLKRDPAPSCQQRPAAPHRPAGCEVANDPQGWSAFFPGRDAYVAVNGVGTTNAYTMEAWIKRAGTESGGVMDHGNNGGALYIDDAGRIVFWIQDTAILGPVIPVGAWRHVAGTFDGSTGRLYLDGVQVATGTSAKQASGTPTFYVGLTNQPVANKWFHGFIDEAAYYNHVVPAGRIWSRWHIGTWQELAGPAIPPYDDMNRPTIDTRSPANGALYSPDSNKVPVADFDCADIEDPAPTCVATLDGNPIADGANLSLTPGPHTFTVTATDANGLHYSHTHSYTVLPFRDLILFDAPGLYFRFDEADSAHTAVDQTGAHNGEYKNDTVNGPVGISGDGNTTRSFLGQGGYVAVNGVPALKDGFTISLWIDPQRGQDMAVFDHGAGGGGPSIWIDGSDDLHFRMPDGTTLTETDPLPAGFFHVAARWDGVLASLWINGVKVAEAETTKPPSGTPTLYVGFGNVGLPQPWFRGLIDEVSYYPTALRDGRIVDHWFADPPAPASSTGAPSGGSGGTGGGGTGGGGLGGGGFGGGGGGGFGGGGGGGGSSAASGAPAAPAAPVTAPPVGASPTPTNPPPTAPSSKQTPKQKQRSCAAKKTKKKRAACRAAKRKAAQDKTKRHASTKDKRHTSTKGRKG